LVFARRDSSRGCHSARMLHACKDLLRYWNETEGNMVVCAIKDLYLPVPILEI
jgi:hypothetical protein